MVKDMSVVQPTVHCVVCVGGGGEGGGDFTFSHYCSPRRLGNKDEVWTGLRCDQFPQVGGAQIKPSWRANKPQLRVRCQLCGNPHVGALGTVPTGRRAAATAQ